MKILLTGFLFISASHIFAQTKNGTKNSSTTNKIREANLQQNFKLNVQKFKVEDLLDDAEGVFWLQSPVADYKNGCYGHYNFPKIENLNSGEKLSNSSLFIKSNSADYMKNTIILTGDLSIKIRDLSINAHSAKLDLNSGIYQIDGDVGFMQKDIFLQSDSLNLNTKTENTKIFNAHFIDQKSNIHAAAKKMQTIGTSKIILEDGVFTTCPPKNKSWYIKASQLELDRKSKQISATHIRFYVGEFPIFYFPWLSISLDKSRKTGFLTPSLRFSTENGFDLGLPFYVNIHPQLDATLIGRYISKRGFIFQGESRYMLAEKVFGDVKIGYMAKDKKANKLNRWYFSSKHSGYFGENFNYLIDFNQVSDIELNKDIRLANAGLSASQVLQLLELNTYWKKWTLSARVKGYQTLANGLSKNSMSYDKTYNMFNLVKGRTKDQGFYQLPQVLLKGKQNLGDTFSLDLTLDLTYFDKLVDAKLNPSSDVTIVNQKPVWSDPSALRLAVAPKIKADFKNSWGFITPEMGLTYTYTLMLPRKNADFLNKVGKLDKSFKHLHKLVPAFGLNMGLTFDRLAEVASVSYIQSLTPKIYLGYTPYINNKVFNQSFAPFIYDGGETPFNESDLFSYNRLSGFDRIGDKSIITLALNHTWLRSSDLTHKFSFDFIQGFYPTRRRIGKIMDEDIFAKTRFLTPFIAKINWNITDGILWSNSFYFDWQSINSLRFFERVESSLSWNNDFMRFTINYLYASNHSSLSQAKLNSWSYKKNSGHQLSATGVFNLSNNWRLFAKYGRYLTASAEKEHIAGIEYNNCCMQIQLLYNDKLVAEPSYNVATKKFNYPARDYGFMFNISFKGLVSAGNDINSYLRREISGFDAK